MIRIQETTRFRCECGLTEMTLTRTIALEPGDTVKAAKALAAPQTDITPEKCTQCGGWLQRQIAT